MPKLRIRTSWWSLGGWRGISRVPSTCVGGRLGIGVASVSLVIPLGRGVSLAKRMPVVHRLSKGLSERSGEKRLILVWESGLTGTWTTYEESYLGGDCPSINAPPALHTTIISPTRGLVVAAHLTNALHRVEHASPNLCRLGEELWCLPLTTFRFASFERMRTNNKRFPSMLRNVSCVIGSIVSHLPPRNIQIPLKSP